MSHKRSPPTADEIQQDTRLVRKANQEIGHRVKSGKLSLVSRKILNVLLYYAQTMRDKEDEDGRWCVPVSSLVKDIKFGSRNYDLLRASLDELQNVKVARPTAHGGITSEWLIPSYTLDNTTHEGNEERSRGERKRGGVLMLWFMLPPELKKQMLDPEQYTKLPILYMASLRTVAGLALYEICRRYVTNPGGVTHRDVWENWFYVLTGEPQGSELPEYKYFKRDTVKKAIVEINELTDISVELSEFREGRYVREIQFAVRMKAQGDLSFSPPPVDTDLLARITVLGVSLPEAERMASRYSESVLLQTVELLEARIANSSLPPIESAAAYLKKALRDGYVAGQQKINAVRAKTLEDKAEKAAQASAAKQAAAAELDAAATTRMELALERFDDQPIEARQAIEVQFRQSNPAFARTDSTGILWRKALGSWLARNCDVR